MHARGRTSLRSVLRQTRGTIGEFRRALGIRDWVLRNVLLAGSADELETAVRRLAQGGAGFGSRVHTLSAKLSIGRHLGQGIGAVANELEDKEVVGGVELRLRGHGVEQATGRERA